MARIYVAINVGMCLVWKIKSADIGDKTGFYRSSHYIFYDPFIPSTSFKCNSSIVSTWLILLQFSYILCKWKSFYQKHVILGNIIITTTKYKITGITVYTNESQPTVKQTMKSPQIPYIHHICDWIWENQSYGQFKSFKKQRF